MHFCVNLVCQPEGTPEAVLLRAGRIVAGEETARARRTRHGRPVTARELARGPARLCQALDIDRDLDGADVCDPASPLRIRPASQGSPAPVIAHGPRVGVSRAADLEWRFWRDGDPTVSPYRPHVPRRRLGPTST